MALLGDAAFVARPHVATGAMKAAIDAETFADALSACAAMSGRPGALQAQRQSYGAALVARGRHIGAYFEARDGEPRSASKP